MNYLTLYGYEEDGELLIYRCRVCGSAGSEGSYCPHDPPIADAYEASGGYPKRKPVRVPQAGEEPRYTLEQLLGRGAETLGRRAYERAITDLPLVTPRWDEADERLRDAFTYQARDDLKHFVLPALDHFTQLPAGVGADGTEEALRGLFAWLDSRQGSAARGEHALHTPGCEARRRGRWDKDCDCGLSTALATAQAALTQPVGIGADNSSGAASTAPPTDSAAQPTAVSADSDGNQQPQGGDDWQVEAIAALAEFDDHGDYEAPVEVLRRLVEGAPDAPVRSAGDRRSDSGGGSVQCDGVALAQPESRVEELLRDEVASALEYIADEAEKKPGSVIHSDLAFYVHDWDFADLIAPSRKLAAELDHISTQQSSGGQEAEDICKRLKGIAYLIEMHFRRDDATRDARFLRKLADRLTGGQEGGVEGELRDSLEAAQCLVRREQERKDKAREEVAELRDDLKLVGESTNDPRILKITRAALARKPSTQPISDYKRGEGNG